MEVKVKAEEEYYEATEQGSHCLHTDDFTSADDGRLAT